MILPQRHRVVYSTTDLEGMLEVSGKYHCRR